MKYIKGSQQRLCLGSLLIFCLFSCGGGSGSKSSEEEDEKTPTTTTTTTQPVKESKSPSKEPTTTAAASSNFPLSSSAVSADGFLNESESQSTDILWVTDRVYTGKLTYTGPRTDADDELVCDATGSYDKTAMPRAADITSDGTWSFCVKISLAGGKTNYTKGQALVRDTVPPTFTALALANAASDGYINDSEKLLVSPLWTLTSTDTSVANYTASLSDAAGSLDCDATQDYSLSDIESPSSLSADGVFAACVRLADVAGNFAYGKSDQITRDVVFPVFTSLVGANEASDAYIKSGEEASTSALLTLSGSGHISDDFTAALDDSGTVTCNSSLNYLNPAVPLISSVTADGTYAVCSKLSDLAGNSTYGKSQQIIRDTVSPSFTALSLANEASDGVISYAERNAANPGWTLSASGHATEEYTAALDDASAAVTCNSGKTYGSLSVPLISSIATDGTWAVCVKLTDAAGNIAYGKSDQVLRDITAPSSPTPLTATAGNGTIDLKWALSTGTPASYLVVRGPAGSAITFAPANGTSYNTGLQGSDQIIYRGLATVKLDSSLTIGSTYNYAVYSYDAALNYSAAATASAVPATPCPANFVFVPGDPDYQTKDFCLMKYEAKDNAGVATSQATSLPWASISAPQSKSECGKLGPNYFLSSNEQWMTLATQLASQNANWSGGTVGSGNLFQGHSDSNPNAPCAASSDDSLFFVETTCTAVSLGDTAEQRRTMTLANGQVIWDLSGNISEIVDLYQIWDKPGATASWYEYSAVIPTAASLSLRALVPHSSFKSFWVDSWNSSQGIGRFYPDVNGSNGQMTRGGSYLEGTTDGGIFRAAINLAAGASAATDGFRCTQLLADLDATKLVLNADDKQIKASWTAVGGATGYVLVRGAAGALPTFQPISGTSYTAGSQGSDAIVYAGGSLTFTDTSLINGTDYHYALYAWSGSHVYASPTRGKEIPLACPSGYVLVPGDADYGTDDFCLMKYEAMFKNGIADSSPGSDDNFYATLSEATGACAALGAGYQVMSNPEWMSAAANIAAQGSNWSSGTVGTGNLFAGHSDDNPDYGCPTSSNDSLAFVENNCTPKGSGQGEDSESTQRRTLYLASGKVIWDMAGNNAEYVNAYNRSDKPQADTNWYNFTAVTGTTTTPLSSMIPTHAVKSFWVDTWNNAQQIGGYYSDNNGSGGGMLRGGEVWTSASNRGLFTTQFDLDPSSASRAFRCTVKRVPNLTPKNFVTKPGSLNSISLSWDSNGSQTAGYLLVRGTYVLPAFEPVNGATYTVGSVPDGTVVYVGNGTSKLDTGLMTSATYSYRLYAYDSAKNYSRAATSTLNLHPCSSIYGYLAIPGDSDYATSDFCLMKFEAQNDGNTVPISSNWRTPWTGLSAEDAATRCSALGPNVHLVTNDEWMTAASLIASRDANWTGSTVGNGSLFQGHSDNSPASVCGASSGDENAFYVETDCTAKSNGDTADQKRIFYTVDWFAIWDFTGNASEYVSYFNAASKPSPLTSTDTEFTGVTGTAAMPLRYLIPTHSVKSFWDDSWTATQGVGQYYTNGNASGGAMIRGAAYNDGTTVGGLFRTNLAIDGVTNSGTSGFRCAESIGDADASALTLVPASSTQITATWSATSASGYMLVRGAAGSEPTFTPSDGTVYAAGAQGSDTVLYAGTALTYSNTLLTAGTKYYYALYSYDASNNYTFLARDYEKTVSCPSGYVLVPGDKDYGTQDFCVMKYEASDDASSNAVSQAATPWVSILPGTARMKCTAIGPGYDLISNAEWMTLGANAAAIGGNWTGASVGSGVLVSGHNDDSPNQACAASSDDSLFYVESSCTPIGSGDSADQKRTLTLSSNGVVWDLSGNVWEWVSYGNSIDKPGASFAWYEFTALNNTTLTLLRDLIPTHFVKTFWSDAWNSGKGIGQVYPGNNAQGGTLRRGGRWFDASYAGVFAAAFNTDATDADTDIGFRCSYKP